MNCYIHIPFCNNKCKYCRFASLWKIQNFFIKKYLNFLLKEIKKSKNKKKLNTIYFWWGTPSVLKAEELKKIINLLEKKFLLNKNCEISLETTPDNISLEKLILWEKIWINRISIWIQTLNNKSLKEIWRWNTKIIFKALNEIKLYLSLKHSKIKNFSIDFIIGLPFTKKWETKSDIQKILKKYNFIKHISVYLLEDYYEINEEIEENNSFEKIIYPNLWKKNSLKEEDFLEEYLDVKNFLEKNNFFRYEISNFAKIDKKSYECLHNKWYWNHIETIWFWLSAASLIKNSNDDFIRYSNSSDFLKYYNNILEEKYILTKQDIFLEKIMFWLRTNWIKKSLIKFLNKEKISFFIQNSLLKETNDKILITDKWVLLIDYILKEII
jgi:oxygen-independent coproporphyrinogen-3 oxidase